MSVLALEQYSPRDPLMLCRGAFGSAPLIHRLCLTGCSYSVYCISFLLAECLLREGASKSSSKQAITLARYDEGILATNHCATTGGGCYHNMMALGDSCDFIM